MAIPIASWQSLTELFNTVSLGHWYFRGESQEFTDVLPVVDRLSKLAEKSQDEVVLAELQTVRAFHYDAMALLEPWLHSYLNNTISQLIVMRHYGAPTRLIDWTLSPWIALLWASRESLSGQEPKAGRILGFSLSGLEVASSKYRSHVRAALQKEFSDLGKKYAAFLSTKYLRRPSLKPWVYPLTSPGPAFPRLRAQQGRFTIAGTPYTDHWKWIQNHVPDDQRLEITISPQLKGQSLWYLQKMGIEEATMLPDVGGVCQSLCTRILYQRQELPRYAASRGSRRKNPMCGGAVP
jgi:hypothetical protein